MKIRLKTIEDVKLFVNAATRYYEGDIDIAQGKYKVDGRSMIGIFSLNLLDPVEVTISNVPTEEIEKNFYNFINKWKVEED